MTNTIIDSETGVRFSRVFYITPDISVLKGSQCGWSIEVIGELPQSRDPLAKVSDSESVSMWQSLSDDMVKTILRKGKDFALSFVCPATEHIRLFLLDSTFTRIEYQFRAKARGGYSSKDNFGTLADYSLETPTQQRAEQQPEQEVRPDASPTQEVEKRESEEAARRSTTQTDDIPESLIRKLEANGMSRQHAIEQLKTLKQRNGRYCLTKEDSKDWFRGGFIALWSMTEPGGLLPDCSQEGQSRVSGSSKGSAPTGSLAEATLISYLGLYPGLVKTYPGGRSIVGRKMVIDGQVMFPVESENAIWWPLYLVDAEGGRLYGYVFASAMKLGNVKTSDVVPLNHSIYWLKLPIKVGTVWKDREGPLTNSGVVDYLAAPKSEATILAMEDVIVPAGRFAACAKLRAIFEPENPIYASLAPEVISWYCPGVGNVKTIFKDKSGQWHPRSELLSVTREPAGPGW